MRRWGGLGVVVALAGCGRIGFGAASNDRGGSDARTDGILTGVGGDAAVGTTFPPLDPALCVITDTCSPCVTSGTQMFGNPAGGISVTNNATGIAVAWSDGNNDSYVSLFDATGAPAGSAQKVTSKTGTPQLAWNGSGYGLISTKGQGVDQVIDFVALTSNAAVTGSVQQLAAVGSNDDVSEGPVVATSSGYAVLWSALNVESSPENALYLTTIATNGSICNAINVGGGDQVYGYSIAWNGDELAIAYSVITNSTMISETRLARYDAAGHLIGQAPIASGGAIGVGYTQIAANATSFAVAWIDNTQLMFAIYSDAGAPTIGPRILATTQSASTVDSLIARGSGYALAIGSTDSSSPRITDLLELDADGTPTTPVVQFGQPGVNQQFDASLANAGPNVAVLWAQDGSTNVNVLNVVVCH